MKTLTTGLIKLYQGIFSPNHGLGFFGFLIGCRFYPSCSEYSIQALDKHGLTNGIFRSIIRILRCNPWSRGGVDLP